MKNIIIGLIIPALLIGGFVFIKTQSRPLKEEKSITIEDTSSSSLQANEAQALPESEVIRVFFRFIDEKKPAEAVKMMLIRGDSEKQEWAVQFNAFYSVKMVSIESFQKDQWTATKHTYKVALDVVMNPKSATAIIPYYGWDRGNNIRWITIEKSGSGVWQISTIATGP